MHPVPGTTIDQINGDIPFSWREPVTDSIVGAGETTNPANPLPVNNVAVPVIEGESDYEAMRRMIAIYKQKIIELEGQLPENKR